MKKSMALFQGFGGVQPGDAHENHGKDAQRDAARNDDGGDVPSQEERLEQRDIIARGDEVGDGPDGGRHVEDVIQEAGEHEGRHEGAHDGELAGQKLVFRGCGDDESQPQRHHQEEGGDGEEQKEGAADGDVKDEGGKDHGDGQADHAEQEVGGRLGGEDFPAAHRGDEEAFQRPAFVFPGHDQGGEQSADHGHDGDDDAGDQVVVAVVGFIEAGAGLHFQGRRGWPTQGGRPGVEHRFKVVADEGGLVGIDAVDDDLDFCEAPVERVRGVALQGDEGVRLMGAQQFFRLPGGEDALGVEVFGEGEPRSQVGGLAGGRHGQVRDAHVFDVHAHAVAEEEQEHRRQDDGDADVAGITDYLVEFLDDEGSDPLDGGDHEFSPPLFMCSSVMDRKASSREAGEPSSRGGACLRISSGEPSASVVPSIMMSMLSQNSASPRKCVVMMMVTPFSARELIRSQKSRRASGSAPEVGSSRKRISGEWSRPHAMLRRCL